MTWLVGNERERGRIINKSRQLHQCALSVISLSESRRGPLQTHGLLSVTVASILQGNKTHTHHAHLRLSLMGEAGLMGSLKPRCTARLTHTHTR